LGGRAGVGLGWVGVGWGLRRGSLRAACRLARSRRCSCPDCQRRRPGARRSRRRPPGRGAAVARHSRASGTAPDSPAIAHRRAKLRCSREGNGDDGSSGRRVRRLGSRSPARLELPRPFLSLSRSAFADSDPQLAPTSSRAAPDRTGLSPGGFTARASSSGSRRRALQSDALLVSGAPPCLPASARSRQLRRGSTASNQDLREPPMGGSRHAPGGRAAPGHGA
jgi:hypothetical protein